jgi:hypothetical protein
MFVSVDNLAAQMSILRFCDEHMQIHRNSMVEGCQWDCHGNVGSELIILDCLSAIGYVFFEKRGVEH